MNKEKRKASPIRIRDPNKASDKILDEALNFIERRLHEMQGRKTPKKPKKPRNIISEPKMSLKTRTRSKSPMATNKRIGIPDIPGWSTCRSRELLTPRMNKISFPSPKTSPPKRSRGPLSPPKPSKPKCKTEERGLSARNISPELNNDSLHSSLPKGRKKGKIGGVKETQFLDRLGNDIAKRKMRSNFYEEWGIELENHTQEKILQTNNNILRRLVTKHFVNNEEEEKVGKTEVTQLIDEVKRVENNKEMTNKHFLSNNWKKSEFEFWKKNVEPKILEGSYIPPAIHKSSTVAHSNPIFSKF